MIFLHPWIVALAPLAALPVLVHLFLRLRRTSLPFSSLMFFLKVDPHAQARRRLREFLLLLLRMLILLLVVLALSRPQLSNVGGGGAAAVVLLIDTSASMGMSGADQRSSLVRAQDGAVALLEVMSRADTVALITTVIDPAVALPAGLVSDRSAVRTAIERLTPTEAASDVPRAMATAVALLGEAPALRRELQVFTDAQSGEWEQPGAVPEGVTVTIHRLPAVSRSGPDVAIRAVHPPDHRVLIGRPARSSVVLVNHDASEAAVSLRIAESNGPERLLPVVVPARGETTVPVVLTATTVGPLTANVRLSGDAFSGDDGSGIAVWAEAKASALLMGEARASGLLAMALSPEGDGSRSGLLPTVVPWSDLETALKNNPLVLVVTWNDLPPAAAPLVQSWVTAGGRLLVLPPPHGAGDPPAAWAWLGVTPGPLRDEPAGQPLTVLAPTAQAWADLRGAAGSVRVSEVRARRWRPLTFSGARSGSNEAGIAVYGLADGTALVAEQRMGTGLVVTWGLAFHPSWSDLPLKGWSLAMVHALALPAADDSRVIRLVAGQPFPPSTAATTVRLRSDSGAEVWSGPRRNLPPPPRSGAYLLDRVPVAVTAAAGEGILKFGNDSRLAALGTGPQRMLTLDDPRSVVDSWHSGERGFDLTAWLLVAALVALAAEGWIATGTTLPQTPTKIRMPGAPLPVQGQAPVVLVWMPIAPEWMIAILAVVMLMVLVYHHRRLRQVLEPRAAWWHVAPRALVALLVVLLLLGPTVRLERTAAVQGTVLALVDTSSSMELVDDGHESRGARALAIAKRLAAALPSGVELRTLAMDTRIRGPVAGTVPTALNNPPTVRPGDPAAVLRMLGGEPAARGVLAIVALTDGGDEPFTISAPPPAPLSIIGIGTDSSTWKNLAVNEVQAPATAEVRLETIIRATVLNHSAVTSIPVKLELREGDRWVTLTETVADVRGGRAQVEFRRSHDRPGLMRYRVIVPPVAEEVAVSDNVREFAMDVRAQTLHVLFFTRELGADYKALRQELARDPGLTFTGLLRTTVHATGERYLLQGDRLDGDAALEAGLPTEAPGLARYGVIILGAFPASAWRPGEQEALRTWINNGGTLVLLGGDQAFAAGGYTGSVLASVYPFTGDDGFVRGSFPVAIPPAVTYHPAVAGVAALLPAAATVDSRNRIGPPTPAATVLMTVSEGGRTVPLIVSQPVGQGTVVAIATNTLWRIARAGPESAFGTLWRQLVRQQSTGDRERRVRVAWDRERYRPGDSASATITALEPGTVPRATLRRGDEPAAPIAIDSQGRVLLELVERGDWTFRVLLGSDEAYSKILPVAPTVGEGAHLLVDDAVLGAAALAGGGTYAREPAADKVIEQLVEKLAGGARRIERGVFDGWWTVVLVAGLLTGEWIMRRRRNWL